MTHHEVRPEYRASRSLALALPYAAFLGLPRKAIAQVAASSRRAARDCRSSIKRFAAGALSRRKARAESPPCERRGDLVRSTGDMVDPVAIEASIAERARCARIVRRGIELGVGPHAAALAFQTSLNPDAAIALVERLASISKP